MSARPASCCASRGTWSMIKLFDISSYTGPAPIMRPPCLWHHLTLITFQWLLSKYHPIGDNTSTYEFWGNINTQSITPWQTVGRPRPLFLWNPDEDEVHNFPLSRTSVSVYQTFLVQPCKLPFTIPGMPTTLNGDRDEGLWSWMGLGLFPSPCPAPFVSVCSLYAL